jgi:hypothetical protein
MASLGLNQADHPSCEGWRHVPLFVCPITISKHLIVSLRGFRDILTICRMGAPRVSNLGNYKRQDYTFKSCKFAVIIQTTLDKVYIKLFF